jgi:thioredoxin-related protein
MNRRYTLLALLFQLIFFVNAQTQGWFVSSSDAKTYAVANNHLPIMLVFAGSDWCKPCMELKTSILKSETFLKYFPSRFALLYLDFPLQKKNQLSAELKKQNEALAAKYNTSGFFPNVVMINTRGEVLGSISFKHQSPVEFIQECDAILKKNQK